MLSVKEIYELSAGVEYHLRELEKVVPALRDVKESLDALKRSREGEFLWQIHLLKEEVDELKNHLRRYGLQEASKYETEIRALKTEIESSRWPEAVEKAAICMSEEELFTRGEGILDLVISENVKDCKFLDFGCGKGHVVSIAHQRGAQAVGYDIDISQSEFNEPLFTDDFEIMRENGPYEIILLHDVLDHIKKIDPITALQQVRTIMSPSARVYVRCHPWCSRHGGHIYDTTNKAFLHLVLDDVELTRLCGCQADYNIKVTRPLDTYRHWFTTAQLEIRSEICVRKSVEQYFLEPSHVHQRLVHQWENSAEMIKDMEIEFVEYIVGNENPVIAGTII